jgi:RNA polymerase sigma-54 factor
MRPTLKLGISPHLTITPELKQSIRLLQLSALELDTEIQRMLDANPLLETETIGSENTPYSYLFSSFDKLDKPAVLTLNQHLLWQMELAHFSADETLIATLLIDAISEEGYLSIPLTEIQENLAAPFLLSEIEQVLIRIQQFDPPGVGARNLTECLSLQLESLAPTTPWLTTAKKLVTENWDFLIKKKFIPIQKILKLKANELKEALKILRSLHPKPGITIAPKRNEYITPDVLVLKKNGTLSVELNQDILPKLKINTYYASLIRRAKSQASSHPLKEQLKTALSFMKGLKVRHETLLRVSQMIVAEQSAFFEQGESAMKPLSLQIIADRVGLHESTISRITTEKYLLTPQGIFELKYFFSNALSLSNSQGASATAVRSQIKKIIAKEPSQNPLSDHRIKVLLSEMGIHIARRTVTKYRETMRIPPSAERKHIS